ncbi:MAG: pilus assembly protein [Proteobacteria bacterium]|nr:pilus assembly protein [Pseudomonadota bacterium]
MLMRIRDLMKARGGLAAVEFALIAPVMGTLLLGTIEICDALECHQKVTMMASSAADLVAQASKVSSSDMSDIFNAASAIIAPFSVNNITIIISSVQSDGTGNGTVAWSQGQTWSGGAPKAVSGRAVNSPITLTQPIMSTWDSTKGAFTPCKANTCSVILAEVTYYYTSPIGRFLVGSQEMTDVFYERPRKVAIIPAPS